MVRWASALSFIFLAASPRLNSSPECAPIKIRIQHPPARHCESGNPLVPAQPKRNLLRNLPRRPLQPLRQFKTHRPSRLPHLNLRRSLEHNRQRHPIFLANVPGQRLAQPVRQCLVHVSSFGVRLFTLNSEGRPPCLPTSPPPHPPTNPPPLQSNPPPL